VYVCVFVCVCERGQAWGSPCCCSRTSPSRLCVRMCAPRLPPQQLAAGVPLDVTAFNALLHVYAHVHTVARRAAEAPASQTEADLDADSGTGSPSHVRHALCPSVLCAHIEPLVRHMDQWWGRQLCMLLWLSIPSRFLVP
jgi:hypothetical protein